MGSIDEAIAAAVQESVDKAMAPIVERMGEPAPLVWTTGQAAAALGCSTQTVARLVDRGVLPRVPHMGTLRLIPRAAVERLVASADTAG